MNEISFISSIHFVYSVTNALKKALSDDLPSQRNRPPSQTLISSLSAAQ